MLLCKMLDLILIISGEMFSNLRKDNAFERNVFLSHTKLFALYSSRLSQKKDWNIYAEHKSSEI